MTAPVFANWDGENFVPLARFKQYCDKHFVVGLTYPLVVEQERSAASHAHYFAAIAEAWRQLPEDLAADFLTPEHLRKWALCKAGYADERSIVCSSRSEALRIAAFIEPIDEYAVVAVIDDVIKVYTAKSQSVQAMNKREFQASKQAVLDILDDMLGTPRGTLKREAGRAA